jgi:hypothetical protein
MLTEPIVGLQAEQTGDLGDVEHGCRVQAVPWREGGWQVIVVGVN